MLKRLCMVSSWSIWRRIFISRIKIIRKVGWYAHSHLTNSSVKLRSTHKRRSGSSQICSRVSRRQVSRKHLKIHPVWHHFTPKNGYVSRHDSMQVNKNNCLFRTKNQRILSGHNIWCQIRKSNKERSLRQFSKISMKMAPVSSILTSSFNFFNKMVSILIKKLFVKCSKGIVLIFRNSRPWWTQTRISSVSKPF